MERLRERVAAVLAAQFKATIARSAGMPFDDTGVKIPSDEIWLAYADAAIVEMARMS